MVDFKVLVAAVMAADLDGLARLTVADTVPGAEGDLGAGELKTALARASLEAAQDDDGWFAEQITAAMIEEATGKAELESVIKAAAASTAMIAATLARTALLGGWEAAAVLAWSLVGGSPIDLEPSRAVFVAGPSGLAVYGGRSRPSALTGGERAVEIEDWGAVIGRLTSTEDTR